MIEAAEYEVRADTSRPWRLGTRRRRPPKAGVVSETGTSCSRRAPRASSLDTEKQLKTTVAEWLRSTVTEKDLYREQEMLRRELNSTVHEIWQGYAQAGDFEKAVRWEKQWSQIHNCQTEWIGYKATCCGAATRPLAVPIGCNHRLCPLCAWHRSQVARVRIKTLYDRLTHPAMLTLTIPSIPAANAEMGERGIHKGSFHLVRKRVRKFISQHKDWIRGGVYSLETTYNRRQKTWHLHCHILADLAASLPPKSEKTRLAGQTVCLFTAIKMRLEFDWLRLWSRGWGKPARKTGDRERIRMAEAGESFNFESWVIEGRGNRLKEWTLEGYRPIAGLSAAELARRTQWNRQNRRVIDVRPVDDRDGAAREVLKYITKAAGFCDLPEAVEGFCDAVRGARLIQTFGSWYGAKLDTVFDPEHLDDWGEMKCSCGRNEWQKTGVFFRADVEMDTNGRWLLRRAFIQNCRGTVPRPTIRFLEESEESDCEWQTR